VKQIAADLPGGIFGIIFIGGRKSRHRRPRIALGVIASARNDFAEFGRCRVPADRIAEKIFRCRHSALTPPARALL
jgi:hypothetical protein